MKGFLSWFLATDDGKDYIQDLRQVCQLYKPQIPSHLNSKNIKITPLFWTIQSKNSKEEQGLSHEKPSGGIESKSSACAGSCSYRRSDQGPQPPNRAAKGATTSSPLLYLSHPIPLLGNTNNGILLIHNNLKLAKNKLPYIKLNNSLIFYSKLHWET